MNELHEENIVSTDLLSYLERYYDGWCSRCFSIGSFMVNDYTFEILSATLASIQSGVTSDIFQKQPRTTLSWLNEKKNAPVIKTPNPSKPSNKTVTFSGTADLRVIVPTIQYPYIIEGFGKYSFTANGQGTVIA